MKKQFSRFLAVFMTVFMVFQSMGLGTVPVLAGNGSQGDGKGNTYTVTYEDFKDGVLSDPVDTNTYATGDEVTVLGSRKEHDASARHFIVGWTTKRGNEIFNSQNKMDQYIMDPNSGWVAFGDTLTVGNSNIILWAVWAEGSIGYTVTYLVDGVQVGETEIYQYQDNVTIRPKYEKLGYIVSDWSIMNDFRMPREDVVIKATTTPGTVPYTIEYYYEENGVYPDEATTIKKTTGTTDTTVQVTEEEKTPEANYGNYVFDATNNSNVLEGNVAPDGSLVLKVYFKEQFTVTYLPGDHGTLTGTTETENIDYGTTTPAEPTVNAADGYSFTGWNPSVADTVTADATYTAQYTADQTSYKVEYYYQSGGVYSNTASSSVDRSGTTDSTASVTEDDKIPAQAGYVYDTAAGNVESGVVTGDGTLALKVYFKQQLTVTYKPGDHGAFAETSSTVDYNAAAPAAPTTPGEAGYDFAGWDKNIVSPVTESAVYTALWTAKTDILYTVEYYYQQNGQYASEADRKDETRIGTTGATVSVTDADKVSERTGYVYDASAAGKKESGVVAGDGTLVLKVYFKEQFTVTYKPGNHGTFAETSSTVDYNAAAPATPTTTGEAGYNFAGWDKEIVTPVTESAVYTAQWTAREDIPYTVEYYYQQNGQYTAVADSKDETRVGTTGATVSVTDADKVSERTGYVYDASAAGKKESGTVAGDGSLVLKVYFKQQFTVTYKPGAHGNFNDQKTENIDYGTTTPAAPQTIAMPGYSFKEWSPSVANTVIADATYVAQWTANDNTKYTVEFYYQENGQYPGSTQIKEERKGTTDTLAAVTAADKTSTRDGYVFDTAAGNVLSGNVAGDGSLVLKVYFKQQFTVIYKPGTKGTFAEQKTEHIDYGTATPAAPQITGVAGYTFNGWDKTVAETVTANATYTAQWSANNDTKYTVEFYYQTGGQYGTTADVSADRYGTTDTTAAVTDDDKTPARAGYVFDASATTNVLSGKIAGDGSLVLKVYFKQQFTVTYKPGDHGTFTEQQTGSLNYGTATPTAPQTTGDVGYTFNGWDSTVASTVTADATYTAQWTANTNTKYTVEYYYEANGAYTAADSHVDRAGTTDTTASVTAADKTPSKNGYVYDEDASNVESGTIAGDGSLVLKVYFKQQFTVIYKPGEHGTFEEEKSEGLEYGDDTPEALSTEGEAGYTFDGWDKEVAETVTADATYVAQWSANTDTKYTVEFYYQAEGEYPEIADDSDEREGTTDTTASVTAEDKTSTEDGYVYDTAASNVESGKIAGDGSLVLKVYFKQQFTVTYKPGDHGTFEEEKTEGLEYGDDTPEALSTEGEAGYTFDGWDKEVAETVTADATYTAQWKANTDTKYTVEHYLQNTDGKTCPEEPAATDEMTGTTDELTEAEAKEYPGFTAQEFEQVKIAGDGSTVIKIYYTRNADTTYRVNHFLQDLDGTYPETPELTEKKVGMTGTKTEAAVKEFEGFKAVEFEQKDIAGDGSTVINIYYERQSYTVTYKVDGEQYGEIETHLVGELVEYRANPTKEGYTFSGWAMARANSFTMPAENVVIEGTFAKNPAPVPQPPKPEQEVQGEHTGDPQPTPAPAPADPNRPDTGDHSQPMLWTMMMIMSMIGACGAYLYGKKRKYSK